MHTEQCLPYPKKAICLDFPDHRNLSLQTPKLFKVSSTLINCFQKEEQIFLSKRKNNPTHPLLKLSRMLSDHFLLALGGHQMYQLHIKHFTGLLTPSLPLYHQIIILTITKTATIYKHFLLHGTLRGILHTLFLLWVHNSPKRSMLLVLGVKN